MNNTLASKRHGKRGFKVFYWLVAALLVLPFAVPQATIAYALSGANVLAGKAYTATIPANASYPDTGATKLTDGNKGGSLLADPAWQGRFHVSEYAFTADLGSSFSIDRFSSGFYKYSGAAVITPQAVTYSYSTDGVHYTDACTLSQQGSGTDTSRVEYSCSLASAITARYIKLTIESAPNTWSLIDEWEAFGIAADDGEGPGEGEPGQSNPAEIILNGTFLQPELGETWSSSQWENEFTYMQDIGMDHLILQWSANTQYDTAVYPSGVPGLVQHTSQDIVKKALEMGEQYDMDIYIGLQLNHEWFVNYTNDYTWLMDEANTASLLVEDLWQKYSSYSSFKGWYLSFEVDNWNLPNSVSWQRMADFYNEITGTIKTVTPNMPIMISPFYNVSGGLDATGWQSMWTYILSRTDIDILALQDGYGAGHAATNQLAAWFSATKQAITAAAASTELWSDTETFTLDFNPMDLQIMLDNMLAVKDYVSAYTSFSFNHYLSPQTVNPLYYTTYKNYTENGLMDSQKPSVPGNLTATALGSMEVALSWQHATDDTGVVGYQIYRNNELVHADYTGVTSFSDKQLNPSTTYQYAIKAFDAAGNLSDLSAIAAVTTASGNNYTSLWSAGKSYTASMAADTMYPDSSGNELTNGSYGSLSYNDAAWQGRNTDQPYHFIVDLGSIRSIKEVNANFLQVKSVYILLPKQVKFYLSDDNVSFTEIGTIGKPAVSSSDQQKRYRLTDLSGLSGRYVKVEVMPASSAWTFIDELEVRG